jgi:polyisoprenyl-phosphate glycosyltransferase
MMLGTDVSGLTTTAATAAAQGLSIVVPLYNEAAGLAALHQRLGDLAKTLRHRYGLVAKSSMSMTAAPTPRSASRAG